jgi:hypothetical protein
MQSVAFVRFIIDIKSTMLFAFTFHMFEFVKEKESDFFQFYSFCFEITLFQFILIRHSTLLIETIAQKRI